MNQRDHSYIFFSVSQVTDEKCIRELIDCWVVYIYFVLFKAALTIESV